MHKTNIARLASFFFFFLFSSFSLYSQSRGTPGSVPFNWLREVVYTTRGGNGLSTTTYFDGLGREHQRHAGYPSHSDLITFIYYDSYGRVSRRYLPYAISPGSGLDPLAGIHQQAFYQAHYNSDYGYSEVVYDDTPQSRVIEESLPGDVWRLGGGHTQRYRIAKNTPNDLLKYYSIVDDTTVVYSKAYSTSGLIKKETIDPQGDKVYQYYNIREQLIAEEIRTDSGSLYTYYVYDDLGLLRYVIPPQADKGFQINEPKSLSELKSYCFYTEYDERHRPYKNYVPGAGCTISLYDNKDRLVLSQSEALRQQGQWLFTKYDMLSRPIISGLCSGTEDQHRSGLFSQTIPGETRGSGAHGYTNHTYPTSVSKEDYLTVTYYDNYDWPDASLVSAWPDTTFVHTIRDKVAGRITGTKEKVLGIDDSQWLLSATYYDDKYHEIQSTRQLYPGGLELIYRSYNYVGNLTRVKEVQTIDGKQEGFDRSYTYNIQGYLTEVKQQLLDYGELTPLVSVAKYAYNDLWQITEKTNHNGIDTTNYVYAIDGKQIGAQSPLFSYKLHFDKKPDNLTYAFYPRYDGNVSMMEWQSHNQTKAYRYEYDPLKQLHDGSYMYLDNGMWAAVKEYGEHDITYDLNGNITSLRRTDGQNERLHDINNEYDGNRLARAQINDAYYDYRYDANGNMISDGYKGINITYNSLNLPSKIFAGTEEVSYIYSASGQKLATKVGDSYTYYRGSFVYNNGELDHLLHPEGLIRKASGGYVYYYAKKDHLGSTRVLCHEANGKLQATQMTEYYPFGLSWARHTNTNVNRYLFSGKELQDQVVNGKKLNLYDFGARNYDPVLGRWFNIDPQAQKYYSTSPYAYVLNTPVNAIDPDGKLVIFVNGMHHGFGAREKYWNGFDKAVMGHLDDKNAKYYDGSLGGTFGLSRGNVIAARRYSAGYIYGLNNASRILKGLSVGETIKVITHSMGAAYAKGLIQGMIEGGVDPSLFAFEADFAPFQPLWQEAVNGVETYQYSHFNDSLAGDRRMKGAHFMNTNDDQDSGHSIDDFWIYVNSLPPGTYNVEHGKVIPE